MIKTQRKGGKKDNDEVRPKQQTSCKVNSTETETNGREKWNGL